MAELWISELKVGDKVVVDRGYNTSMICTVEKITPSGFIKANGILFNNKGYPRGSNWGVYIPILRKATPEVIEAITHRETIALAKQKMQDCTPTFEQAQKILELLD